MWLVVDLLVLVRVSCKDIRRNIIFEVKDSYLRDMFVLES